MRESNLSPKSGLDVQLVGVARWGAMLFVGLLLTLLASAPASATTFTLAQGNGSETITNSSTATWTENSETLRFSVTGASDYYVLNSLNCVDGLLGVGGGNDCVGVDEWALVSSLNGAQGFSATVSITGKVFDLRSMVISSWGGTANYVITTSKGGSQGGSVGAGGGSTSPSFSGPQFDGISSFTIQYTGTGSGGENTIFTLRNVVLENITGVSTPSVSGISPNSGPAAGGTSVVITGTDFGAVAGAAGVKFGSTNATNYTVDSATQITATAPAGSGAQYVTVTNAAGTSATGGASQFTYIAAPTVSSLSPASGPLAGGNSVVLTGTNFAATTAVFFGTTHASGFTVHSATQITATAPAGTAGDVNVTVTTAGGTSATGAGNQYTYVALPVLSSVSPALGTTAGGTSVTLTGTGFTGATAVSFGANAATGYIVNSATQITATAPAGAQGTVDVTVTTAGGTSATGASTRFSYAAAPTATTGVASNITATGATIAGTANDNGAATTLSFEYGLNTSYGSTATATPATLSAGAGSTPVSGSLSGLSCNTTYHFRLKAVNGIATTNGLDASFTTAACPPSATTNAASALTATAATLNATVNDNGAATSVSFDWGTSISYGNSASASPATVNAGTGSTAISGSLSGLTCNTVYHYRVSATSSAGATPGSDVSFTTGPCVPGAPTSVVATADVASASVAFTAPADNGGAAISGYTVTSSPGGLTGTGASSPITVSGLTNGTAYTFTVTATNSAGTGAPSAPSSAVTPRASQIITFNNPGAQNFGTSPTLSASATSGLTPTFTSSTTGVCTITSGGALTFVTAGSCTINADQAGDASYLPAPQVSQTFTVNAVQPGAPTIGTATAGDTQASVAFTAPTNTGGTAITSYTVTVNPADVAPVNGASSPIVVTGLTNGQAYTFTVTATNSAGTGPASAASNSITPAGIQTITFGNPGAQNFGTTPTLMATSDSGLPVSFSSSTTGVCTITSGGGLTFLTAGTCTINADQAGNGSYLPATQVSRTFTVNPVAPGAPTGVSATAGHAQATVSFTVPASNGGTAITGHMVTSIPGGITGSCTSSPCTVIGLSNGTTYTFTVTATNSAGTGAASVASSGVTPIDAPPVAGAVTETVAYSSTDNPITLILSGATATSVAVAGQAAHGTATATGITISYTPNPDFSGSDSFTYTASNAGGTSAPATVSITVNPQVPVVGNVTLTVQANSSGNLVPLALSGGAASSVAVAGGPAHGSATVSDGSILYTPATDYNGDDSFTYTATNAGGTSAKATVTVFVRYRPDPTKDAEVVALLDAQISAAERFAKIQIDHFQNRLQGQRRNLSSFANQERGAAMASSDKPILKRRSAAPMEKCRDQDVDCAEAPSEASVGNDRFSRQLASLAVKTANDLENGNGWQWPNLNLNGASENALGSGVDIWSAGTVTIGSRDSSDQSFTTSGLSVGGDVRLTERLTLGLGAGFGHEHQKIGSNGSRMSGDAVALVAYGSFQPWEAFFIDGLAGYNRLDLDGRRYVTDTSEYARSKRHGDQWFLSLSGVYEHLAGKFLLAPYGRLDLTSTRLERNEEQGAADYNLIYFSQTSPSTRLAVGLRGETEILVAEVASRPYLRLEYQHELTDRGTARMAYADDFTTVYRLDMGSSDPHSLVLGAGSDFLLNYGWILGADYRFTRGSASTEMHSIGAYLKKQF